MSNKGFVKISAKATWREGEHPEAPDLRPTLELRVELTDYGSRAAMANMLRQIANAVDEGTLHPFDVPLANRTVTGEWDEQRKEWVIDDQPGEQR